MTARIRWGRIIAAAVFSELGVIAILLASTLVYAYLLSPGAARGDFQQLGARVGGYVAPPAGGLAVFLSVLWLARKLDNRFVAHGTLAGVAAVVLASGFLFSARPEDRLMYAASFAIRILGGYLGGLTAQARGRRQGFAAPAMQEAR